MMRKKLFALLLSATMCAGVLSGCGSNSGKSSSTNAESTSDDAVTLRVLAGQSTTDSGIEDIIDEYLAAKYPNITLQWECVDWGNDFQPKMQTYIQSGLPDIMIGKAQDVATYGSLGLLADLSAKDYTDNMLDAAKDGITLDGKVLGLTYNCLYQGVYYNRALFDEYDLEVPDTLDELQTIIDTFNEAGITPFASHMVDTWSIGNVTMQFAVNDVFCLNPTWGDDFRAGKVTFADSAEYRAAYEYNKLIYDNTWSSETFSMEQTACDAKMVAGDAAMKVSGSWSIQNFLDIDENFDFGIFPFPNQTGDAKLLFEPNMTFMASADSKNQDAIDKVFEVLCDPSLATEIYDFTNTASMLKDVSSTFVNPSQSDINAYSNKDRIQDVNLGNNQLVWSGFQEENAKDIAEWLQGNITLDDALAAADARKANSSST